MELNLFGNFSGVFDMTPEDPEFETYSKLNQISLALLFISKYGAIDGSHHKDWLLDQVSRILMGTPVVFKIAKWTNGGREVRFETGEPSEGYLQWVDSLQGETYEDGSREYFYDYGIAP